MGKYPQKPRQQEQSLLEGSARTMLFASSLGPGSPSHQGVLGTLQKSKLFTDTVRQPHESQGVRARRPKATELSVPHCALTRSPLLPSTLL